MQRMPLEKRLRSAESLWYGWPAACRSFVDVYFHTLSEMSADRSYMKFYNWAEENDTYGEIEDAFVAQAVAEAVSGGYPKEAGTELLCQILIRPFTDKNIWKAKGENET